MDGLVPRWVRLGVIVTLAVPQLLVGLWSTLLPERWFEDFPGVGPGLVAAEPPFNGHLVRDVGAGFLATGIGLLAGALWAHRNGLRVALLTFVAFTLPHVLYHAFNPADSLSGIANVTNVLSLGSGLVLAAVFAYGSGDRPPLARAAASSS